MGLSAPGIDGIGQQGGAAAEAEQGTRRAGLRMCHVQHSSRNILFCGLIPARAA